MPKAKKYKFHHWLLPTKKNKFHPIALRSNGLLIFAIILAFIPLVYNLTETRKFQVLGYSIDINATDLNAATNQNRANAGLQPLTINSQLTSAAQAKAADMFADQYWAHIAPDGATPWTFILASGYDYSSAGENLAKDFSYSSGVVAGWMASDSHRANLLNSDYTDVGYAVVNGVLLGEETTLVVAEYGARAATQTTTVVATTTPSSSTPTTTTTTTTANNNTQTTSSTPSTTSTSNADTTTDTSSKTPTNNAQNTTKDTTTSKSSNSKKTTTTSAAATSKKGEVKGISSTLPVRVYNSLNWGQKVSLLLMSTLALLFIMKHTFIWRQQKRGLKNIWLRAHPLGQAAALTAGIIITVVNSIGVVL